MRPKILSVWGTRPEAVKMAPVVRALAREKRLVSRTCVTAQHRGMLDQALSVLRLRPDHDLDLMRPDQTLASSTARILEGAARVLKLESPDMVLVQGDTTTAFAASLAAFYARIPVGHVEAGLRTGDFASPFPEEMNRVLADAVAALRFAPTPSSRAHLLREGIAPTAVSVTGNTVVDALKLVLPGVRGPRSPELRRLLAAEGPLILVTAHRRESFGEGFKTLCRALTRVADSRPDVRLLYPAHPNPAVAGPARRLLRHPRIFLTPPLDYADFLCALRAAYLVLTDSGGVQEEAPYFGKPVLVLREVTERPEALLAGASVLVGTDERRIVRETARLLTDAALYRRMAGVPNPFGDGKASERIVRGVLHFFGLARKPADWKP